MKQVSIIVPIYNVAPYLERCLLSIVNQTYKNIDVLLVDDCSPDNSMEIAETFIQKQTDKGVFRVINHNINKGLSEARNTGINNAKGDYIYFLDSDDEITANCIESLVNNVGDADMVLGGVILPNRKSYFKNKTGEYNNTQFLECFFRREAYTMAWNRLLKKDFVIDNQLYFKPGLIHEDNLWSYQVAACPNLTKVKVIANSCYIYHIRGGTLRVASTKNVHHRLETFHYIQTDLREKGLIAKANNYLVGNNFLIRFLAVSVKFTRKEILYLDINNKYPFKGLKLGNVFKNSILRIPLNMQYLMFSMLNCVIG